MEKGKYVNANKETRVAVMSIIVENPDIAGEVNALLHDIADYVIGRMGVPYRKRSISIISVVVDAPQDIVSAVSGKLGKLSGVSCKTVYSNVITRED